MKPMGFIDVRPLRNLEIESRKRALEIFRGILPPQRSASKDDCLSAKREFRLCSEARRSRVEKWEASPCGRSFPARKRSVCFIAPLIPAYKAGIAGCAPGPARGGIKIFKGLDVEITV